MTEPVIRAAGHPDNLMIRVAAMPEHTNYRGDVFGGWILAQMDLAAGVCGARAARGHVATVAVQHVHFRQPVFPGDVLSIYAMIHKTGRTSLTVDIDVMVSRRFDDDPVHTHDARFVVVAIDEQRRPRPVPGKDSPQIRILPENEQ